MVEGGGLGQRTLTWPSWTWAADIQALATLDQQSGGWSLAPECHDPGAQPANPGGQVRPRCWSSTARHIWALALGLRVRPDFPSGAPRARPTRIRIQQTHSLPLAFRSPCTAASQEGG